MALKQLNIATPADAVNKRFYNYDEEDGSVPEYVIVGVAPTQNITGLFNAEKPWFYTWDPDYILTTAPDGERDFNQFRLPA